MSKLQKLLAAAVLALPMTAAVSSAKEKIAAGPKTIEVNRSLFSGSESRVYEFGWLRPDCTSSGADVRIVKQPSKGVIRLEDGRSLVMANKSSLQKLCHGKPLDTIRLFYKANDNTTGHDNFSLEVDTKLGFVQRYAFTVDIR